jgi:dTDP-4-amino-4,6-dideoxygalactose transaminase
VPSWTGYEPRSEVVDAESGAVAKSRLDDLAILGGEPAFKRDVHVGLPNIGERSSFLARVADAFDRRWLTNDGVFVREWERRIAEALTVEHCVATANGTQALELTLEALEITGDVVIPAYTFVATAHAVHRAGARPVFVDVRTDDHTLDPELAEAAITPATTAIVAVHLWGRPCDVAALADIAARRGLRLVFDAAHAFGCSHGGRMIGSFGDAEVFSFHATKVCNSFEGGALTTASAELDSRLRLLRNFGFRDYDDVASTGTNAKMSEIAAAMGLTSLESLDEHIARNRANFETYRERLSAMPGIRLLLFDPSERSNYHHVVVEVDAAESGIDRDLLVRVLWQERVLARRYFTPGCHRMEPYRTLYPDLEGRFPVTERLAETVLALPTGAAVDAGDIARICSIIALAARNGRELARRLSAGG